MGHSLGAHIALKFAAAYPQRVSKLVHRHSGACIGEIRTDCFSSAVHHVAGSALPFPEEELLSGRGVAECGALGSRRIQRV